MLLTIPASPEKGEFQNYTLDVSDLIDLVDSAYYETESNWRKVIVAYKSSTGNQLNLISFIPDGNPTISKQGYFAPECFSIFAIQSITIVDKQNGTYILNPTDIPDVANYNIVFVSGGSSFYDIVSTSGTWIDSSDDNSLLALQVTYTSYYGAKFYYSMVLNNTSGEVDESLTSFVNSYKVSAYYFNSDNSKVYVVGQLGLSYLGESLPAFPVGPTYSSNPPRIVSVDTVTNEVTYIATLEDAGAFSGFSGGATITVDETSNVAVIVGQSFLYGINIVTGAKLWSKSIGYSQPWQQLRKVELYTAGSFLIGSFANYDGVNYASITPIKVDILTGNRDITFPLAPQDGAGNGYPWSLTPDKTKIVQIGTGSLSAFTVYSSGSWSSFITPSSGLFYVNSISTDNSSIYFVQSGGKKTDFAGIVDPAYNLGVPFYYIFNTVLVSGSNVYADFGKFSGTTGAYNTSFGIGGGYFYPAYANGDSVYYMPTTTYTPTLATNPMFFNTNTDNSYGGYVAIIDTLTREKIIDFPATYNNPTFGFGPIFGPTGSNVLFAGNTSATGFHAYNYNTGAIDSSYPAINSATQGIGGYGRDGDYMYLSSYYDGANTFNVTDTSGTYNLVTKVMRYNLITKLVDQTFLPSLPSPFGDAFQAYSFTDNYIYISCSYAIYLGPSGAYFYRINRTTQAVETITPATFGVTTPSTFNTFTRVRVQQIATNKIVIYPDQGNLKFDDKPYVICNEDTLTQTGLQPDTITQFPRFCAFNVTNNEIGGIYYGIDDTWHFVTFSMTDNTKTTSMIAANAPNTSLLTSSGNMLNPGNLVFIAYEDAYIMFLNGVYTTLGRPVGGVIKMSPVGIINND